MLLKIYTSLNTIKVIDKIDDVEIHAESRPVTTWVEMYNLTEPPIRHSSQTPQVENYDWKQTLCTELTYVADLPINIAPDDSPVKGYAVDIKLVDYLRNGEWKRVAIQQYAYLCNDDGKTIAKVGA